MSTSKKFIFTGALTGEQLDFINQHGYIHFENNFSHGTFAGTALAISASGQASNAAKDVTQMKSKFHFLTYKHIVSTYPYILN